MDSHGHTGSACEEGSSPPRLTRDEIALLKVGDVVHVTWDGGNGPHSYKVVEDSMSYLDMCDMHNKTHVCPVRPTDLLDDFGCYVSLP